MYDGVKFTMLFASHVAAMRATVSVYSQ